MGSFANFTDTALLEKCVAHAAQQPRPAHKYEIDQVTTHGIITGYHWVSIPCGFNEAIYPGWWYTVEANHEQGHVNEDDIELLTPPTSEPVHKATNQDAILETLDQLIKQDLEEGAMNTAQSVIHVMTQSLWLSDVILLLKKEIKNRGYAECLPAVDLAGSMLSRLEESDRIGMSFEEFLRTNTICSQN